MTDLGHSACLVVRQTGSNFSYDSWVPELLLVHFCSIIFSEHCGVVSFEAVCNLNSSLFGSNPPVRVGTWKTVPQVKLVRRFASEDSNSSLSSS